MTDGSVIVAIVGVGVALLVGMLGVLLPVVRSQGSAIRRELDQVRGEVAELRGELATVRIDLRALSDRVARIEGALTGPGAQPGRLHLPDLPETGHAWLRAKADAADIAGDHEQAKKLRRVADTYDAAREALRAAHED